MRKIPARGNGSNALRAAPEVAGSSWLRRSGLLACCALLVVSVGACGRGGGDDAGPDGADARITQAELGNDWPLTVPSVDFGCAANGSLTITAPDGTTYAVDSSATTQQLPSFAAIWADDPTQRGGKKLPGALMDRGMAYCRNR